MPERKTIDPAIAEMLRKAEAEGLTTAFDRAESTAPCPIGHAGNCCHVCFMGPCRLVGKTLVGICGATKETVSARNLARAIAAGAAAHSDHGRDVAKTLQLAAQSPDSGYTITDANKLRKVAKVLDISIDDFVAAVAAEGVPVSRRYPTPLHRQPVFRDAIAEGRCRFEEGSCPNAEALAEELFTLQVHPTVNEKDLADVAAAIEKVAAAHAR